MTQGKGLGGVGQGGGGAGGLEGKDVYSGY